MSADPFGPLDGTPTPRRKPGSWITIVPVPADAPKPPASHYRHGKPVASWCYRDPAGNVLGYIYRFDTAAGKTFQPLTYARPEAGGKPEWRWQSWAPLRPLYGLDKLALRPQAPVLVVEGEAAADAASKLLPDFVVVTSPGGSKSADKADWSPVRDRQVAIWPDADAPGAGYAKAVAAHATKEAARSVAVVEPPGGTTDGWDAVDAIAEGWDQARAQELIATARPYVATNGGADGKGVGRRRTPQRDIAISYTGECEFWRDPNRVAYVTFPVNDHQEHWPVRSREFRMWLSARFYEETEGAIGGQALEDSIRILEARAVHDGREYQPFLRTGQDGANIYLDLCDVSWRVVEITRHGWRVVGSAPVKMIRSASMRPLPEPEGGHMIEELRRFVNLSEDEFVLVLAWLVAALRPRGPYPILVANGEQGSGKSDFCRMLRNLVDPSAAPIRSVPKDEHDLTISAFNSHILAYDNLSGVAPWLADALCRLSTGGGFATRTLHTDRDETIFEGQRPIMLNGITLLTERADLAERSLTVHLKTIPPENRRTQEDLYAAFEQARRRILGALLDGVSAALRNMPGVTVEKPSRMADFERWSVAAGPGFGWEDGQFLAAYYENRRDVAETSFEADPVAVAISDFMTTCHPAPEGWSGTPTDLLVALNTRVSETMRKSKIWPAGAQALGNRLERIKPLLRARGFCIERRQSMKRIIIIVPPKGQPGPPLPS